jgi:hypothetical protein
LTTSAAPPVVRAAAAAAAAAAHGLSGPARARVAPRSPHAPTLCKVGGVAGFSPGPRGPTHQAAAQAAAGEGCGEVLRLLILVCELLVKRVARQARAATAAQPVRDVLQGVLLPFCDVLGGLVGGG